MLNAKTTQDQDYEYLNQFDAAPSSIVDTTTQIRAEARLDQLLAEMNNPSTVPTTVKQQKRFAFQPASGSANRNRHRALPNGLRWAAIPVALAAGFAAAVIWTDNRPETPTAISANPAAEAHSPTWLSPPTAPRITTASAALATWQPDPTPLEGAELVAAQSACHNELSSWASDMASSGPSGQAWPRPDIGELLLAERRGAFAFLAFGSNPDADTDAEQLTFGSCFVLFPQEGSTEVQLQMSGISTMHALGGSGSIGSPLESLASQTWSGSLGGVGTGSVTYGAVFNDGTGALGIIGLASADEVTEVAIQTDTGVVTPTLNNGWFAAWWPVTPDADDLAAQQLDFDQLANDPNRPLRRWPTTFAPILVSPAIDSVSFTYADGGTEEFDVAGFSWPEPEDAAIPGRSVVLEQLDPDELGFAVPLFVMVGEPLSLPTMTDAGSPISWSLGIHPDGVTLADGVLSATQAGLSESGVLHPIGLSAATTIAGRDLTIDLTMYALSPEMITDSNAIPDYALVDRVALANFFNNN